MNQNIGDGLRKLLGMPIPQRHRTFQQPAAPAAPKATQPHLTGVVMGDGLKAFMGITTDKKEKK